MGTPVGPVKFLSTCELEPTSEGTRVEFRFAAPKTARERAIMEELAPMFAGLFEESHRRLNALLENELAARDLDRGQEPALPTPKPDGLFAEIQPLLMVG